MADGPLATPDGSLNADRFQALRSAVQLRERPRQPGVTLPFVPDRVTLSLGEAKALLALVDAARECADWHMSYPGNLHVTDVKLWEAVTGKERRADG
jgi:hypothetical protein